MKLEFEQKTIDDELLKELDFNNFLKNFEYNLPFLPLKILKPLEETEAQKHFSRIKSLLKHRDLLEKLIESSKNIPFIEDIIPFYKNNMLEHYHINLLGKFVIESIKLDEIEKPFPIDKKLKKAIVQIKNLLEQTTEDDFSSIILNDQEKQLKEKLEVINKELKERFTIYEQEIFLNCKLKMIYPYPKEISLTSSLIPIIKKYRHLSLKKQDGSYLVNYNHPPDLKTKLTKHRTLQNKLNKSINSKLTSLNNELAPYFSKFQKYYDLRKENTFYYCLIVGMTKHSFTIPDFRQELGIEIEKAKLPILEELKQKNYKPLSIKLKKGANILFGANMAGKTTVLKTLFFHLTAIKFGLPVPAEKIQLSFPKQTEISIKDSSKLSSNVSTFGNELLFFSKKMEEGSYILIDEMLHSTNPVGGMELSKIILQDYANRNCIFLCNTHYLELLQMKNVNLYKMKDVNFSKEINSSDPNKFQLILNDLINKMPYEIEKIKNKGMAQAIFDCKKPLYVALYFPIPESIKKKILSYLNKSSD